MFKSIVLTLIFGSISFLTFGQDTLRTYHAEDTLKVKEVILRINGKANGPVKRYDLEGRLVVIGSLKNDQRHGIFYDLDPETGDTLRQVTFQNNQREGEALSFYTDGTLRQRSNFVANYFPILKRVRYPKRPHLKPTNPKESPSATIPTVPSNPK